MKLLLVFHDLSGIDQRDVFGTFHSWCVSVRVVCPLDASSPQCFSHLSCCPIGICFNPVAATITKESHMSHVLSRRYGWDSFVREVHRCNLLEDFGLLVRRDLAIVVAVPCSLSECDWRCRCSVLVIRRFHNLRRRHCLSVVSH